jgi:hypothetical protein
MKLLVGFLCMMLILMVFAVLDLHTRLVNLENRDIIKQDYIDYLCDKSIQQYKHNQKILNNLRKVGIMEVKDGRAKNKVNSRYDKDLLAKQ